MKIVWLGHAGFRIEIGSEVLLVDPWLGCPTLEGHDTEAAIAGATRILLTHGHFDHATDAVDVAKKTGAPLCAIVELAGLMEKAGAPETVGFNMGGTLRFDGVEVTMVPASHSSSLPSDAGAVYAGQEAGFMIAGEGHTIYLSGDTGPMADMGWMGKYHKPDIGILSAGGHFTMDMAQAAWVAREFFDFKTLIPCHYGTFPLLEQSAAQLKGALPGVRVIEPQVMQPIDI